MPTPFYSMAMRELTPMQRDTYDYILKHFVDVGRTPSLSDIQEHFGRRSRNMGAKNVDALYHMGMINKDDKGRIALPASVRQSLYQK